MENFLCVEDDWIYSAHLLEDHETKGDNKSFDRGFSTEQLLESGFVFDVISHLFFQAFDFRVNVVVNSSEVAQSCLGFVVFSLGEKIRW